jgi:hypothetical protein
MTLKSRKLLATVLGILVVSLQGKIGLSEFQADLISKIVIAYLAGQGLADFGKEKK